MLRKCQLVLVAAVTAVCGRAADNEPAQTATYGYLRYMDYAPNGQSIAIATAREVEIWDVGLGKLLQTYPIDPMPTRMRLAWSPDSKSLVLNTDRRIILWEPGVGVPRKEISYERIVPMRILMTPPLTPPSVQWSPKGDRLAYLTGAGATAGPMILPHDSPYWRNPLPLNPGMPVPGKSKIEATGLHEIAWSPDGSQLAGISDNSVGIWDADSGAQIRVLRLAQSAGMAGRRQERWPVFAWSPNGAKIATCDWMNFVQIWDAATGEILLKLDGGNSTHNRLAWSRKSDRLALSTAEAVIVWDAATGARISQSQNGVVAEFAAFAPDLDRGVLASHEGQVEFWPPFNVPAAVVSAVWGSGDRLAVWGSDRVRVFDVGPRILALDAEASVWSSPANPWSPFADSLAIPDAHGVINLYSESPPGHFNVWKTLSGAKPPIYAVGFAPRDRVLAALGGGSLWVWDVYKNDPPRRFSIQGTSMVWTSDHTILIAVMDGSLAEFDVAAAKPGWTFTPPGKDNLTPIQLAPGGYLFFAHNMWWCRNKEGATAVTGLPQALYWTPDGKAYATRTEPRFALPITVTATATGNPIGTLRLQPGVMQSLTGLAWSPDGRSVAIPAAGSLYVERLILPPKD